MFEIKRAMKGGLAKGCKKLAVATIKLKYDNYLHERNCNLPCAFLAAERGSLCEQKDYDSAALYC